jgi:hypothetical protein
MTSIEADFRNEIILFNSLYFSYSMFPSFGDVFYNVFYTKRWSRSGGGSSLLTGGDSKAKKSPPERVSLQGAKAKRSQEWDSNFSRKQIVGGFAHPNIYFV